ncbi:MAG: hypothetical protein Q8O64_10090 [Sideroxyarcus sp.]|nr:hypothetical protein [Sideroxyarcus sp.]
MEKLQMHSPDFTQENIAKLAGLFPNCVTESKNEGGTVKRAIDFDQLRQELSTSIVDGPQERYQLNWPGKREALLTANAPIAKTLRPCREESVDFDTTQNLFVEGDNLYALKLLQETYLNKVKMIYIDPPYNKDADTLYKDDFAEDNPATVHQINVLTVVASESYKDFVTALQRDISESLSARPRIADEEYFTGKVFKTATGDVVVTPQIAKQIYKYLLKNDYTDDSDKITQAYHDAKTEGKLADLPAELLPYTEQVFQLIDSVFSDTQMPGIDDDRKGKTNPLSANFDKKEFQELWNRINRKAAYTVHFETPELIKKCVVALEKELKVSPLQYTIVKGEQLSTATYDDLKQGESFEIQETKTDTHKASIHSTVKYDLIGKVAEEAQLTRSTIASILQGINVAIFSQYKTNPEDFIAKAARLINEQKATVIIEKLSYDSVGETYGIDIFTQEKPQEDFSKAVKVDHHIYDYVFTDSKNERTFVAELDTSAEVVVYAKLPKGFFIPTPVGNYNPDWAIAFHEGTVKHIYFIAETKGSMSSMELRKIEECKIECARKFFTKITSDQVKYDVVDSYGKLMELVK